MNAFFSKRVNQIARTYWQPMVLTVLLFLVLTQVYSWCATAIELNKVDNLIEQTQAASLPETVPEKSVTAGKPGFAPGKPPQEKEAPNKPVKNIFKKDEANFVLTAVYLNKAVINGQAVEMGGKIGKATLKEIGVWDATIEIDGTTRKLDMFKGGGAVPVASKPSSRPKSSRTKTKTKTAKSKPSKSSSSIRSIRDIRTMRELKEHPDAMRLWEEASPEDRQRLERNWKAGNQRGSRGEGRALRVRGGDQGK